MGSLRLINIHFWASFHKLIAVYSKAEIQTWINLIIVCCIQMSDLPMLFQNNACTSKFQRHPPPPFLYFTAIESYFLFWSFSVCIRCGCVGVVLLNTWPDYIFKEANFIWFYLFVCVWCVCLLSANRFRKANCHIRQPQSDQNSFEEHLTKSKSLKTK